MIYAALFLAVGLPIANACLAMDPGEYLNCPSVPQQAGSKPLMGPENINGAQVYTCEAPDGLLEYDGSNMPSRVLEGKKLTCKPNSGFFSLNDGINVKTKNYGCGTLPCPMDVPEFKDSVPGVSRFSFETFVTKPNGDKEWACENILYQITDDKPNSVMKLGEPISIVCTSSGAMKLVGPGSKESFYNVDKEKFVCGSDACVSCLVSDILEGTDELCKNQESFICTSDASGRLGKDDCPDVYCKDDSEQLYLMTSSTTGFVADVTKLKCSDDFVAEYDWTYDGKALDKSFRFVCGMPKGTG